MRINVIFREDSERVLFTNKPTDEWMNVNFGDIQTITENDYSKLQNKPSINSVVLEGTLTADDLGLGCVYYDTKENWDNQPDLLTEKRVVYIYSDKDYVEDEAGNRTPVAGIKIGDGTSFLIDMPFVSDAATYLITSHVANEAVHVSPADREFWNNKVSAYIDHSDDESLVLSKTSYESNGEIIEG